MKSFKYFTIFSLLLTSAIFVYKYQFKNIPESTYSWETYKKEGNLVQSHKTTKKEMKQARLPIVKNREPASKMSRIPKKRTITGSFAKSYGKNNLEITYINSPSKDWKKKYAELKLKTLPEGTTVLIKHNESILQVNKKGALYVEKVIISIQKKNKAPSSYEAVVNSETGEQLNAWNRTHHENVNHVIFTKKL